MGAIFISVNRTLADTVPKYRICSYGVLVFSCNLNQFTAFALDYLNSSRGILPIRNTYSTVTATTFLALRGTFLWAKASTQEPY